MLDDALIRHAQVSSMMKSPRIEHLKNLREWLERPGYGGSFLRGKIESVWDAEKGFKDLASFEALQRRDAGLTLHLANLVLHLKRSWTGTGKPSNQIYTVGESTHEWIADGIMTIISSIFPVLPIVILFFVNRLLVRLGLILVFTGIFAAVLVFGMRIESDKTLAITTAYVRRSHVLDAQLKMCRFAAIQVVFVGSTSSHTND